MKKLLKKIFQPQKETSNIQKRKLNPNNPQDRQELVAQAVRRTVKEYGKTLEKLGSN